MEKKYLNSSFPRILGKVQKRDVIQSEGAKEGGRKAGL